MNALRALFAVLLVLVSVHVSARDQERPRLLLSQADVRLISERRHFPPLFDSAFEEARARVTPFLEELPDVPLPQDAGGGYTHEQHKRNSRIILDSGILFQLTREQHYADLARDLLLAYAGMYPDLGEHPRKKEQSPGRLFWQSLNEAVWLVTAIQGYDAIYRELSPGQRSEIEKGLLRPLADFLSVGQPETFDKIHNHGTWAVAAVGMTGFVIDDKNYVEQALFGLQKNGSGGFMRQLDELFSPDGYYSEGPYYQRYAMMPFLLFAQSIERNEPERKIFEYRDGILMNAVDTTIQLSYGGLFFPINDAIKDKGLDTLELVYGVSIAWGIAGDERLLSIAELQNRTVLTGDGFRLAQAVQSRRARPYPFRSMRLRDGADGTQGALGILRSGNEPGHQAVVFKATAQGMGHGHFDRLSWLFYDNGREIITDYGAARFLNVESKYGGHYLPENKSWAKQTVAHNTLVVDESSHFGGQWKQGQLHPTTLLFFETGERADVVAARIETAYDGISFRRALVLLKDDAFPHSLVLDVLQVDADRARQLDLPLHFAGHVTAVSHEPDASTALLEPLGPKNGYQHLWRRATSTVGEGELFQLTFLSNDRFYTHSALADVPMQFIFAETGANDPDFNLRHEQVLVQRVPSAQRQVFVSVLEPHGEYNGSREYTTESASNMAALEHASHDAATIVRIRTRSGAVSTVGLSFDPDPDRIHRVGLGGGDHEWNGFFQLLDD